MVNDTKIPTLRRWNVGLEDGWFTRATYLRRRSMSASPPRPTRAVVEGSGTGAVTVMAEISNPFTLTIFVAPLLAVRSSVPVVEVQVPVYAISSLAVGVPAAAIVCVTIVGPEVSDPTLAPNVVAPPSK